MLENDLETINVNVWFNKLESRLQHCLIKDEMTDGFMQYQILINHAEIIAISSGKLDEDKYKEELGELDKKLQERLKKDDKSYKMAFAMIKYKLILKALLSIRKSNMTLNC